MRVFAPFLALLSLVSAVREAQRPFHFLLTI
jgi:hypothetical protein